MEWAGFLVARTGAARGRKGGPRTWQSGRSGRRPVARHACGLARRWPGTQVVAIATMLARTDSRGPRGRRDPSGRTDPQLEAEEAGVWAVEIDGQAAGDNPVPKTEPVTPAQLLEEQEAMANGGAVAESGGMKSFGFNMSQAEVEEMMRGQEETEG